VTILGIEMQAVEVVMLKDISKHRPIWMGFDDLKLYDVEKEVQHC